MGASQASEVQVFASGLNLVPSAHLLEPGESRYMAGINIRKGNLYPFLAPLFIEPAKGNFMYHFDGKYNYYDMYRSNVLYNRIWYWTSALEAGKQYQDGTVAKLGIDQPIGIPLTSIQASALGITGSISYVYTYYDPKSGAESPPSRPSITLDLLGVDSDKAIEITNINPSPDGYQTRLYRIGGIHTMYTAVETLPNTATTYIDSLTFTEMEGMILESTRSFPPPSGLQYLTQHQGRFFGAVGAELLFTPAGNPDSWYALDFIAFDDVITGIASVANGLLVMSQHKSYLISGNTPFQFSKHTLSMSEGCLSSRTIATQEGTAIWLSASGFLMSNGGRINNVSLNKIGRVKNLEPFGAVYVDKRYLMSFGGTLLPSNELYPCEDLYPSDIITESGIGLPQGAVVIDFSTGEPSFSTIADVIMGYVTEAENEIFQLSGEGIVENNVVTEDGEYNIVTESGHSNIVAEVEAGASLFKTFKGQSFRDIIYLSPVYTERSIGLQKQYEKVRVVYNGVGVIQVFDEDGRVFVEKQLASARRVSEWVYIPIVFNRGYGIQFRITGTIIVDSLQWVWTPKESQ